MMTAIEALATASPAARTRLARRTTPRAPTTPFTWTSDRPGPISGAASSWRKPSRRRGTRSRSSTWRHGRTPISRSAIRCSASSRTEIAVYGVGSSPRPRYLDIRRGAIIAAPQRLFDDAGRPLFQEIVRPIAPAVVALVDRNLTAAWFERAGDSLTLMCGLRPKWALVGLKLDEVEGAPPGMVEAPELFAFVASRNSVDGRELMRYVAPRSQVRVRTNWADGSDPMEDSSEAGPAEDFGALPLFCYASLSARLIPRQLLDNQDFHVFRAADIGLAALPREDRSSSPIFRRRGRAT